MSIPEHVRRHRERKLFQPPRLINEEQTRVLLQSAYLVKQPLFGDRIKWFVIGRRAVMSSVPWQLPASDWRSWTGTGWCSWSVRCLQLCETRWPTCWGPTPALSTETGAKQLLLAILINHQESIISERLTKALDQQFLPNSVLSFLIKRQRLRLNQSHIVSYSWKLCSQT